MGYRAWEPSHFKMHRDELPAEAEKAIERVREVLRTEHDFNRRVDALAALTNDGTRIESSLYRSAILVELCRRAM